MDIGKRIGENLIWLFTGAFITYSYCEWMPSKYDCPEDYKGWRIESGIDFYNGKYTISNGCEYEEVLFTPYHSYNVGEIIGKSIFKPPVKEVEQTAEENLDASLKEFREQQYEDIENAQSRTKYVLKVQEDLLKEEYERRKRLKDTK